MPVSSRGFEDLPSDRGAGKTRKKERRSTVLVIWKLQHQRLRQITTLIMCKALIWNVHGLANMQTLNRVKMLCKIHKVSVLAIIEHKITKEKLISTRLKLGYDQGVKGGRHLGDGTERGEDHFGVGSRAGRYGSGGRPEHGAVLLDVRCPWRVVGSG